GLMGMFTLLLAFAAMRHAGATQNWRSTWGKIERSGVEDFDTLEGHHWRKRKRAAVVYSYSVNGRRYEGGRVAAGGWKTSSNLAVLVRRQADKYAEGKPVEVFYNPENPAEAVLERRVS